MQVVCSLVSIYFDIHQPGIQWKQKCKTLHYWSRDIFNFDFLEKVLEIVAYDFSRKMFLMLYTVNWSNVIVWLVTSGQ